jgi:2-polyprenyl-3-methyl-5-hydroxy-6-metoxy-1,4-benzoquinol methylase
VNGLERRSSAPPLESRDSSVPSDGTVKRTRVISIPPDPPLSSVETKDEKLSERSSEAVAEQDAISDFELPETPIEEIESIEEEDIEGFEEEEEEVVVPDSDLSIESDEIDDDETETEVEEITAQSEDFEQQGVVEAEQELRTEEEPKEELSEADLERAIEWVDEDSIDEIDQNELIESKELADLPDEQIAGSTPTPVPEAEESIEIERIPADYSTRLSPPPSPPDTKAKRISAKPPPHPTGNAQQAQASASAQTSERVSAVPVTEEKTPSVRPAKTPRPWWESFFSEDYLRTVMPLTPPQVSKQCDFVLASLGLERGSTILDVGCGLGLHAVELTVRGYLVVGLDLSLPMVTRAAEEAQYRGLKINFLHADIRQIEFEGAFDAVICMGTTFGFFDDESNRDVLSRLHGALKPGGKLLLDVVNRDFAIRSQPNLVWFQGDDCVCMEESEFNFSTSRLHVKRTVMQEDGRQSDSEYSVRLYSLHELNALLRQEGFRILEVSGQEATRGIFFGMNAPRVLLLAMRTNQRPSIHDALKLNSRTSKKPNADNDNK